MYGSVISCHTVVWDENICPLFSGVRCVDVSVDGSSFIFELLGFKNISLN